MTLLHRLAAAVGVQREWRDAAGRRRRVSDDALAAVLDALGYPANDAARSRHAGEAGAVPPLLTARQGTPLALPGALATASAATLVLEDGAERTLAIAGGTLPAIAETGYHRLLVAGHAPMLAVAPPRCLTPADLGIDRAWGPAVQIPALRSLAERPFGGLAELADAARLFGARGADLVAISPVHALNPAAGAPFSPYSPSSRRFLNAFLAEPPGLAPRAGGALIDWRRALPQRLADLAAIVAALPADVRAGAERWVAAQGPALQAHATFDALACRFGADWRAWPAAYHDPHGAAAVAFAADNAADVAFHACCQWLAETGLAAAQAAARSSGMRIGLCSDLAVGVDPGGSDAWTGRAAMLAGLTVGAPPDPLGPQGQAWGLTGFSPQGLVRSAFAPWLEMLRTALRHAGAVRIDHAFGLARLWVIPAGADAADGAYLTYPQDDMMRLIALESHRAGALIVAEDLGTPPAGFAAAIAPTGMLGMRVLQFERDARAFRDPATYPRDSVAMTGTHDTPTVAGWWRGRDLDWAMRLGHGDAGAAARRARERRALWQAIGPRHEPAVPRPSPEQPAPAVTAALAGVGAAGSALALAPLEDMLAFDEAPNLPGTVEEHPNWRRRLPAPLATLLDDPATQARIAAFARTRSAGDDKGTP